MESEFLPQCLTACVVCAFAMLGCKHMGTGFRFGVFGVWLVCTPTDVYDGVKSGQEERNRTGRLRGYGSRLGDGSDRRVW